MEKLILIILITVITLIEAFGQFLLSVHHHSKGKKTHYGIIPIKMLPVITWLLYGVCTYLLLHSYKYTTMGKAEVYWDAMSAIVVPLVGVIYFGNKINVFGWSGITLIVIGTLMLSFEKSLDKHL